MIDQDECNKCIGECRCPCACGSDHSSRYSCIECGQGMCGDCVGHRDEVHCAEWCEKCLEAARNPTEKQA